MGFSDDSIRLKAKTWAETTGDQPDQIHNFVDCVLSREQPVDNLHSAIRSDINCHLVDISVRTGVSSPGTTRKRRLSVTRRRLP